MSPLFAENTPDRGTNHRPRTPVRLARPARWRFCLLAVGLVIACILAEVVVRAFHVGRPAYAPHRFEPGGGIPFTQLPNGPVVYQPNKTFWSVYDPAGDRRGYFTPDNRVAYEINEYGMRGPPRPIPKAPGVFRVLCLGDSITFGEGVRYPDTYPARLERLLASAMPGQTIEVLDAGVQGYGAKDEAALYLLRGAQFHPDVVLLGFFLNDALDFGETIRQNEAMTKELPLSLPARVSRIWQILERRRQTARLQGDYFASIRRSFASPRWAECKEVLKGLNQVAHQDSFRFIVTLFPVLWDLDSAYPFADLHALVAAACRDAGCEFIDLLEVYHGRHAEDLWVHPTDQHPNEIAHRFAAERIAAQILTPAK